jgi:acyl-CoA thioesterase FadM
VSIDRRLERTYRVRFDEAGPDGSMRSSGFLRFAQDLAWIHSESAGFDRRRYRERGLLWLVRSVELDVLENVEHGSELVVSTEVIGFRRAVGRRRSEFRHPGTERPLAVAITDWLLLSAAGRPVRPPPEISALVGDQGSTFTSLRVPLREAAGVDAAETTFDVRRSDADPMAHVNNAGYIDYLDEQYLTVFNAPLRASLPVPRRYRAEFVGSAEPGTRLTARSWQDDLAWCCRLIDEDGRETLRATLEVDPATWVGG